MDCIICTLVCHFEPFGFTQDKLYETESRSLGHYSQSHLQVQCPRPLGSARGDTVPMGVDCK
jgi:hypothetical protein